MPSRTNMLTFRAAACLLALGGHLNGQLPSAVRGNALPAAAVLSPQQRALPSETIRKRVEEVNVVFTVTDAAGHFVGNVLLSDLDVLDEQRPPERVVYFQQQSELPLRLALLIDQSSSMTEDFAYEKTAAISFLQTVLRPNIDEAFVVGFAQRVIQYQDFTSDMGALTRAVGEMRPAGDTRLYDALRFASAKLRTAPGPTLIRRAIVILTDGQDTLSRTIMYDAIQSAQLAESTVFALSLNRLKHNQYTKGQAALDLITGPTGGEVLSAATQSEMTEAFARVKEALRSQYVIGYKPAALRADGAFHNIRIVPHDKTLRVHCRRGYFAPTED